jgi:N-hydroxyarylamine O-acetyltransferase
MIFVVMRFADYLRRIGQPPPCSATLDTLRRLHVAHRESILFENVTIQTGGAISTDVADIERKFLDEGQGGYCFEHNTLFAAALQDAGFATTTLLGRVRRGPPERWCRTHMVLRVTGVGPGVADSANVGRGPSDPANAYLADVGFGGIGLLEPMPLRDGATAEQGGLTYRLRREDHVWVLSMRDADGVDGDMYEFSEDPQTPGDVAVANHFTSTHPGSIFRQTLTIQRAARSERTILRTDVLTRYRDGHMTEEPVARERLRDVARDVFGVELPDGPLVADATPGVSFPSLQRTCID